MLHFKVAGAALLLGLLSACGGGDSGGDSAPDPDPNVSSTAIALSATNATRVANEVAMGMGDATAATTVSPTGAVATANGHGSVMNAVSAMALIFRSHALTSPAPTLPTGAHQTQTTPCPQGGSYTVSPDHSGTAGTVTYSSCGSLGIVVNGSAVLSNLSFTSSSTISGTQVADVRVTESGTSYRMRSTYSFTGSISGSPMTLAISGNRLFVESPVNTSSFRNFSLQASLNGANDVTLAGVTDYASTRLAGQVRVVITPQIVQAGADDFPSSGEMLITDATGRSVRVTILGNENLPTSQLRFSEDVDGFPGVENTRFANWIDLI